MTDLYLLKQGAGLVPANASDAEIIGKWRTGELVQCKVSRPRNAQHHRKFFALLNYGFDSWEPEPQASYVPYATETPGKDFERFRKDITIACGHYELVVNIKGDVRAEAKSISFGSMDEDEFSALYESAISFLIRHAILQNQTRDEIDAVVNKLLEFA